MSEKTKADALAAVWLPLGLVLGVGFGLALDNLVAGIAIGLAFGAALSIGFYADGRRKRSRNPGR
ncbi:hypothetical protein ALI44B_12015 [Leifsonia sp. ALI-44-B]|jgi:zinc transporter ZupT|uniref:hypothetical protein n=1 Tax=Leifsonia sp. ALI-44-B TaxID=1933776 RepID=UPI00097BE79D|nr:hypothetical protein [Leifsonia sp. ALI-44-B]ONI61198.1 hypothetical protein ALI44B_12015 [Leifsonia sp. ALI-44-B]